MLTAFTSGHYARGMGYEVEQKYRVVDATSLRQRLRGLGATESDPVEQEDGYFAHPSRDFVQTDEALRIRRLGHENRLTYKGPKRGGPTKTREEIETPFADGAIPYEQLATTLRRLGFQPVATVRKTRIPFALNHLGHAIEVTLDDAGPLGQFAEVETLAEGPDDLDAAQDSVIDLARVLGLKELESRSYLRMTLEAGVSS